MGRTAEARWGNEIKDIPSKHIAETKLPFRGFPDLGRISSKDKANFCTQLAFLLEARISLHQALGSLLKQTNNKRMKNVIAGLIKDVHRGNSFAKALSYHPVVFDRLFISTVEVGEESGKLAEVLTHLAGHLEKMNALRRKFTQAMVYPVLVISVAVFAILFLLIFIVPTFAEMFKNFQMELPLTTRIVLQLSHWITGYGPTALIVMIVFSGLFYKTLRIGRVRERIRDYLERLPLIGDILVKNTISRFCRMLGTMLKAQVTLVEGLEITSRVITNPKLQSELQSLVRDVKRGSSVAGPMTDSTIFPPMVSQMIAVGEATSELDMMLLKVAEYYEHELDSKVEALSSTIEPILILILGFLVAGILVAMYMPMFDLVNTVGGMN